MKKKVGDIESSPELLDNIATSSRSKPSAKFVPGESLSVSMRKCFFNGLLLKQAPRKVKEKKRPETNRLSQTLLQASTASQWDAASSDFRLIFMVISFLFGICFCRLNGGHSLFALHDFEPEQDHRLAVGQRLDLTAYSFGLARDLCGMRQDKITLPRLFAFPCRHTFVNNNSLSWCHDLLSAPVEGINKASNGSPWILCTKQSNEPISQV
jgi:hypothetical protein